jgi:hypothetical protein
METTDVYPEPQTKPIKCTVKAIPLEDWTGPEGSKILRLQILRESAHEGGKVVSPMHRPPLSPRNMPGTHYC